VINISQTSDEEQDLAYLQELVAILKEFPGQDEIKLSITNEERVTTLKLTHTTNYCPELHQRLVELVGEGRFRLETANTI